MTGMMMKTKPSKYHNQDPVYYRYREFVVGMFLLLPLILIPIIFSVVIIKSDWAQKRFSLYFTHTLNAQINEGNEVYILSKKVGYVKDVRLDPRGFISVMLKIDEQYRPLIRRDTHIRMRQKNLVMGDWQMELMLGDQASQMVEDGDTLSVIPPLDLQALSNEVVDISLLVRGILDSVAHGSGVISHLLNSDSTIDRTVTDVTESVTTALTTLNSVLADGSRLVKNSNVLMDSVVALRVPALMNELDTVLMHTDTVLIDMKSILDDADSIPAELRQTLEHLNRDLVEGEVLIKALQKHWILRKEVREVREEDGELQQP